VSQHSEGVSLLPQQPVLKTADPSAELGTPILHSSHNTSSINISDSQNL